METLPFIDIKLRRNGERLSIEIYRKPTHTGRYLAHTSHHPSSAKESVVHALMTRIQFITDGDISKKREVEHICMELAANGYLQHFVTKATKRRKNYARKKTKNITLPQLAFRTAEAPVRLSDEFLPGLESGKS